MTQTTKSTLVSLPDETTAEVTFKESESTQHLEHFGMPCSLSFSEVEILYVTDFETGEYLDILDEEVLELM